MQSPLNSAISTLTLQVIIGTIVFEVQSRLLSGMDDEGRLKYYWLTIHFNKLKGVILSTSPFIKDRKDQFAVYQVVLLFFSSVHNVHQKILLIISSLPSAKVSFTIHWETNWHFTINQETFNLVYMEPGARNPHPEWNTVIRVYCRVCHESVDCISELRKEKADIQAL